MKISTSTYGGGGAYTPQYIVVQTKIKISVIDLSLILFVIYHGRKDTKFCDGNVNRNAKKEK